MKKQNKALLIIAGAGVALLIANRLKAGQSMTTSAAKPTYKAPPGTTTQQQKSILQSAFKNILPAKKKLKPVIEVLPLENISEKQFNEASQKKPGIVKKAGSLLKNIFGKKRVSGFDTIEGLY